MAQMLIGGTAVDSAVATGTVAEYGPGDRLCIVCGARLAVSIAGNGMALHAQQRLRHGQQVAIRRAVRVMAIAAVFGGGWMLENMWSTHRLMALGALFGAADQGGLLARMRVVATDAGNAALVHRVV